MTAFTRLIQARAMRRAWPADQGTADIRSKAARNLLDGCGVLVLTGGFDNCGAADTRTLYRRRAATAKWRLGRGGRNGQ